MDPSNEELSKAHEGVGMHRGRVWVIRGGRDVSPAREEEPFGAAPDASV